MGVKRAAGAMTASVALACSVPFVGGGAAQTPDQSTAKKPTAASISRGQIVFNDYFCAACHNLRAAGPAAHGILAALLEKQKFPALQVAAVVLNGLQREEYMPGYRGVLTRRQIDDVSAFVAKYSGTKVRCKECKSPGDVQKASTPSRPT
jgi:mono/diheme cytochrome c family protein